jgi:hypothetical protein
VSVVRGSDEHELAPFAAHRGRGVAEAKQGADAGERRDWDSITLSMTWRMNEYKEIMSKEDVQGMKNRVSKEWRGLKR